MRLRRRPSVPAEQHEKLRAAHSAAVRLASLYEGTLDEIRRSTRSTKVQVLIDEARNEAHDLAVSAVRGRGTSVNVNDPIRGGCLPRLGEPSAK